MLTPFPNIQVWDVQTLQEMETLTGHVGIVYALAVLKTSGQTRLFSASYDKTIRVSICFKQIHWFFNLQ